MTRFLNYINESFYLFNPICYENYLNAASLIDESFNWDDIHPTITKSNNIQFNCVFNYKDLHYLFEAYKIQGTNDWIIQYDLTGLKNTERNVFDRLESQEINNGVIAAAFKCIGLLIKEKHIDSFLFASSDSKLIKFYKKLKPYIEKKLNCSLTDEKINNDASAWKYKVNYND